MSAWHEGLREYVLYTLRKNVGVVAGLLRLLTLGSPLPPLNISPSGSHVPESCHTREHLLSGHSDWGTRHMRTPSDRWLSRVTQENTFWLVTESFPTWEHRETESCHTSERLLKGDGVISYVKRPSERWMSHVTIENDFRVVTDHITHENAFWVVCCDVSFKTRYCPGVSSRANQGARWWQTEWCHTLERCRSGDWPCHIWKHLLSGNCVSCHTWQGLLTGDKVISHKRTPSQHRSPTESVPKVSWWNDIICALCRCEENTTLKSQMYSNILW